MSLSELPAELIYSITEFIEEERFLNSVARTCWRLHLLLTPILYRNCVRLSHGLPLAWAAKHGFKETARQAFDAGASTYSCRYNLRQSLIATAEKGHESIARLILQHVEDPKTFTEEQSCKQCEDASSGNASEHLDPLSLAAERGNITFVKLLLAHGVTADRFGQECSSLVRIAAENGHLAIVQTVIEAGYSFNYKKGIRYETPLHAAARQGHRDVVQYLLDIGADITSPSGSLAPLRSAAENGHIGTVKLLLERGADPEENAWGPTALSYAAKNGHVEVVEMLLDHGADLDPDMVKGRGVLYHIAQNGQLQVLSLLLARGARIYPKAAKKQYSLLKLMLTTGWGVLERRIQTVLAHFFRAFLDLEDMMLHGDETTQAVVLELAASYGWTDIVQRILERGCSPDAIYNHSYRQCCVRPILSAIENGHSGVTKLLAEHGADLQQRRTENAEEGVLFLAIRMKNVQIAEILIDHGADIHCESPRGETALAEAALTSTDMFQLLLERGANPRQVSCLSGESAITRALSAGKVGAIKILIDRGIELKMPGPHTLLMPAGQETPTSQKRELIEMALLGGEQMAELLLDWEGLNIDPESIQAQKGLLHAVHQKMPGVVKRLLERGVDPKVPLLKCDQPLLAIATYPRIDSNTEATAVILDLLLAHGADITDWCYFAAGP